MPYVKRHQNGSISSLAQIADDEHSEHIQPTAREVVEFLSENKEMGQSKSALAESDKDIARVTEDLIQLLISKNIILFTELPEAVQQKLLNREKLRTCIHGVMDNFLLHDDDEEI